MMDFQGLQQALFEDRSSFNSTNPLSSVPDLKVNIFGAVCCGISILVIVIFLIRPTVLPRRKKSSENGGKSDCLSGFCDLMIDKLPSWASLPLDYSTVPLMMVLLLFIMQVIGIREIFIGLKGHEDSSLKPFSIIILFFTLAYMSISLDLTGVFDFIAVKSVALSGGSGKALFLIFFILSSLITIATSNDIVILTLTPIICALAKHSNFDVPATHALLFSQFFAANIWSMLLFIGNPTNIIVAQAFRLSFLEYSKWMAIPTICGGLTCLVWLYVWFKSQGAIAETAEMPELDPYQNFNDIFGAIFGSVVFGICIVFVACSNVINVEIWIITSVGCAIMLLKDLFRDWRNHTALNRFSGQVGSLETVQNSNAIEPKKSTEMVELESNTQQHEVEQSAAPVKYKVPVAISRLPWKVAPFVIGVFIIIETMSKTGLTGLLAKGLSMIVGSSDSHASIFASIFVTGFASSIACNIVNNQPMTIAFTNILLSPHLKIGPTAIRGALFAVVIGSNLGGNMTLVGALAGIMWKQILSDKGVELSAGQFAYRGIITMIPVLSITCLALYAEMVAWK